MAFFPMIQKFIWAFYSLLGKRPLNFDLSTNESYQITLLNLSFNHYFRSTRQSSKLTLLSQRWKIGTNTKSNVNDRKL